MKTIPAYSFGSLNVETGEVREGVLCNGRMRFRKPGLWRRLFGVSSVTTLWSKPVEVARKSIDMCVWHTPFFGSATKIDRTRVQPVYEQHHIDGRYRYLTANIFGDQEVICESPTRIYFHA